jgi:RNA polymerase sigma-70 factor (ECF subfamily)
MIARFELAACGDTAAADHIVRSLRPRIARMAAYYARRCGEDADDLLQEAWLGLLEALPQLDTRIGSPDQYLIQRARWRLLDAVKRARLRRCGRFEDLPEGGYTPELLDGAAVREFASRLAAPQRRVLAFLLAGYTWRETGAALRCTSPNIAYHVRQIKKRYVEWASSLAPVAPAAIE